MELPRRSSNLGVRWRYAVLAGLALVLIGVLLFVYVIVL
jgi:hypothetical protein